MSVSVPLVALLAVFAWFAIRFLGVRAWVAVVLVLLGFLLSGTVLAPLMQSITELGVSTVNNR
ncbi:hypothetical protein ACWD4V_07765 [Streptomyces tsukubensis]|uniref:hypothetical protein n=1 Tax=Streptomyces sp. NPDC094448 TaxID=3366063 RepID=UPI0038213D8A